MDERRHVGRTLRSPRLRALLWRSQNGLCGICGEQLDESDWEADHKDPWRITRRTNVHEMQAVHPTCNKRKGGQAVVEIKSWDLLRVGQRNAIEMIEGRVGRTDTTAIVLPCRYGKSDVMRVAAIKLWAEGKICTALALSPGEVLRDQLADATRWDSAFRRYKIRTKTQPAIAAITKPKVGFNPNGEAFLSATTQLVQNNLDIFASWVESQVHRSGLPVLVFVDECQSNSADNEWGKIVPELIQAGAHVVLLTATPERADGKKIPGFNFEVVEEGELAVWKVRPHEEKPDELSTVEEYRGSRARLMLLPDCGVTFREAWAESDERPILCKISRTTFDVQLRMVGIENEAAKRLSELAPAPAARILGKIVRHPLVIREGCRRLISGLEQRRVLDSEFQAIIFCGNDIEPGDSRLDNKHPEEIRAELLRQRPGLTVLIATAEGGKAIIESFQNGHGDVLIVKQMAGVGLDLPRVKVGLDLSPTRTFAAFIQRMFRIATPHEGVMACEWITVDDAVSKDAFTRIVTNQGGEAQVSELTFIRSYDKKRDDKQVQQMLLIDGTNDGSFDDSAGNCEEPQRWQVVEDVLTRFPKLTSLYTHAEIAERAEDLFSTTEPGVDADGSSTVRDTSIGASALRAEINDLAKMATNSYLRAKNLTFRNYGEAIEAVWVEAKIAATWPAATALDACDDLAKLQDLRDKMEGVCRRLWGSK